MLGLPKRSPVGRTLFTDRKAAPGHMWPDGPRITSMGRRMQLACIATLLCSYSWVVVRADAGHLLPGPDHWDELPDATYEVIFDHEVVTTVPRDGELRGVVFSLHGCLQLTTEWGFQSATCPICQGMPEEMVSVYRAVKRGYALVAVGSHMADAEASFHCFNTTFPPEKHHELPTLLRTLRHVLTARGWWHLPRFAYGSSRGGAMTLILAQRFPLQAVASMVMGMRPTEIMDADLNVTNVATGATWAFPPTLLMSAANDQDEIRDLVKWTALYLKTQGVHVERAVLEPYTIGPETFAQRMREVDPATSAAIFWELREAGIIRPDNYSSFLQYESWKKAEAQLQKILLAHFPAHLYASNGSRGHERAFREMLWASEAIHELTAEPMDMMLDFFEANAVADASPLHEAHPFVEQASEFLGSGGKDAHELTYRHHSHSHRLGEQSAEADGSWQRP